MGLAFAFRTDLEGTFWTGEVFFLVLDRYHDRAFGVGTPHQVRVLLDFGVLQESLIYFQSFL